MAETDSVGTWAIGVHVGAWTDPELAEMVAPPVTVSGVPLGRPVDGRRRAQLARSRGNMPVERHRPVTR